MQKRYLINSNYYLVFVFLFSLIFNPSLWAQNDIWFTKTDLPTARAALSASVVNGKFYVMGGTVNGTPWGGPASPEMEIYDPTTDSWDTTKAEMPWGRNSLASVTVNGKIYALGGQSLGGITAEPSVMMYDPQTNTWDTTITEMPEPRSGLSAAVVNDKIYVIGGWNFSSTKYRRGVLEYDPATNSWDTTKAKMLTGRAYLATCVVNNKIYAFGGINNDVTYDGLNTLEVYDPATDQWAQKADMPAPRIYLEAEAVDSLIYIFGGSDNPNNLPTPNVWEYSPAFDVYREVTSMPLGVMHAASGEAGGKIYNFGGLESAITFPFIASSKVFELTPPKTRHVPADYPTIQAAIDSSSDGDRVVVADGTYYENINFKGKKITVASHYWLDNDTSHISKTIIDGSQSIYADSGSVVYFISGEDTTSVLCGFTITGGSGAYDSAIDARGGGGIFIWDSGAKIFHNKISGNNLSSQKVSHGSGLLFGVVSTPENIIITHNKVSNNSIQSPTICGGAVYLGLRNTAYCEVKNNNISYNSTTCTGSYKAIAGGLGVSMSLPTAGNVIVENNKITNNELHCKAAMGSGIYVVYWEPGGLFTDLSPTPMIRNNIIADNYSQDRGAGIAIWTVQENHNPNSVINPQPAIVNNTIVNNKATDGCGIFNLDSNPILMNTILWNDISEPDSREIFNDDVTYSGYTDTNEGELFIYYSDIQGGWEGGEGNIDSDPAFEDSLFHLSDTSWCVGNGTDSLQIGDVWYKSPSLDYFGGPRPYSTTDLAVDIGAVESPYDSVEVIIERIRDNIIPLKFALFQNYPNPFNPKTVIRYELPITSHLDLSIYNTLGQKVATLVNKKQPAGSYQVQWDASRFTSGIYLYRLETNTGFVQVHKLVVLK